MKSNSSFQEEKIVIIIITLYFLGWDQNLLGTKELLSLP